MKPLLYNFFPRIDAVSVTAIDYEKLKEKGIKGIIFDIDNTLVPYDVIHPTKSVTGLMDRLLAMGFKLCLISNNNDQRVMAFNEPLGLAAIARANKPFSKNIKKGMAILETAPHETIIIGDQIFTDVLGGNRLSILTCLIEPIQLKEAWYTGIKRHAEGFVLKRYHRYKSIRRSERL